MNRYIRTAIMLVLVAGLVLLVSGQTAFAQKFSYQAGIQVQNLDSGTATVALTFYNQDGTTDATVNDTIGGNGSKTYFPLPSAVSDGFNGSVVISSDTQVAAIANILGDGGAAGASYVGTADGNTTAQLPLLMKGNAGFDTWFNVQNVGDADANVTVNYSDGGSNSATIAPGAAATFNQAGESHSSKVFSAEVTSDQPVVTTAVEESSAVMFAYSGFTGGSTSPVMPLINANNAGYQTGVQIQNTGNTSTNVTVTYTPSQAGTSCTETQSIPAKSSKTFALAAFANGTNSTCAAGAKFIGSARVTGNSASHLLNAIVNQLKVGVNGEAYSAFSPSQATDQVVLPLILDRRGGYFTGFNIAHVGGPDATVTCTFTNSSYTVSGTLSEGEALTDLQNGKIADNYAGSATCTADDANAQIVAIVNELGPSSTADQLLVYEGVSVGN